MTIKRLLFTFCLTLTAALLAACSAAEPPPETTQQQPTEAQPTKEQATDAPQQQAAPPKRDHDIEITTLLPKDAIPSIDNPQFYAVNEANAEYGPDELVMGVNINGEARAYSTAFLSGHEIVNDVVGGEPIAVTW